MCQPFTDMDLQEERETWEKIKEARSDQQWPDERDTPLNVDVRTRFQKYRGLESFRTSPWDPKENLPFDYARVYQFKNFDRTKRRILNEIDELHLERILVSLNKIKIIYRIIQCFVLICIARSLHYHSCGQCSSQTMEYMDNGA